MSTTDGNGILFYEETDPVSPLHTLLNTGQQSVSDVIGPLLSDWQTITPVWTNVTIGNGSTSGRYLTHNGLTFVNFILNVGSTTSFSSATYVGNIPGTSSVDIGVGTFNLYCGSGGSGYLTGGAFRSGTNVRLTIADGTNISSKTVNSGGILSVNLLYRT